MCHAVQIAHAMGATVVAIDVDQAKLDNMANFGASLTINAREVQGRDMKKAIVAFAKDKGLRETCWKIFECFGSAVGQETAIVAGRRKKQVGRMINHAHQPTPHLPYHKIL